MCDSDATGILTAELFRESGHFIAIRAGEGTPHLDGFALYASGTFGAPTACLSSWGFGCDGRATPTSRQQHTKHHQQRKKITGDMFHLFSS
jgi:hypothetical protein